MIGGTSLLRIRLLYALCFVELVAELTDAEAPADALLSHSGDSESLAVVMVRYPTHYLGFHSRTAVADNTFRQWTLISRKAVMK